MPISILGYSRVPFAGAHSLYIRDCRTELEIASCRGYVDDGSGWYPLFRPRARSRSSCQFPSMISRLATRARTK